MPVESSMYARAVNVLEPMSTFMLPVEKGPLKPGFQLYTGAVDEKPNPNLRFQFEIGLDQPGIVESQSLLGTVNQLTARMEEVVTALTPQLR